MQKNIIYWIRKFWLRLKRIQKKNKAKVKEKKRAETEAAKEKKKPKQKPLLKKKREFKPKS